MITKYLKRPDVGWQPFMSLQFIVSKRFDLYTTKPCLRKESSKPNLIIITAVESKEYYVQPSDLIFWLNILNFIFYNILRAIKKLLVSNGFNTHHLF